MPDHYEQEVKLTAPDHAALTAILQSDLVRQLDSGAGATNATRYHAIYYDSDCGALSRARYTLRARREGTRMRLALKFAGAIQNGLSQRREIETDITDWLSDVAHLPDGEIKREVHAAIQTDRASDTPNPSPNAPPKLIPRVRVETARSIRNLTFATSQIELAADRAHITAISDADPNSTNGKSTTLHELELELRRGNLTDLIKLGEIFRHQFPLTPSTASKHRIGLNLHPPQTQA